MKKVRGHGLLGPFSLPVALNNGAKLRFLEKVNMTPLQLRINQSKGVMFNINYIFCCEIFTKTLRQN